MTSGAAGKPFRLSTNSVDFGVVAPGTRPTRTITLTNTSGGKLAFQVEVSAGWITPQVGQPVGDNVQILLAIDAASLPAPGRQTAAVRVKASGFSEQVTVSASTQAPAAAQTGQPIRAALSAAARPVAAVGKLWKGTTIGASFFLSVFGLALIFGTLFYVVQSALSGTPDGQRYAGVATGALTAIYLFVAFGKAIPQRRKTLDPNSVVVEHQRILRVLAGVCKAAGAAVPPVVDVPQPEPNLRSYGVGPGLSCLYVNQGLVRTLSDDRELAAAFAHEISHLKRFDTFFFCCSGPVIAIANRFVAQLRRVLSVGAAAGKATGAVMLLPLLVFQVFGRTLSGGGSALGKVLGCAVMLFVLLMAVAIIVTIAVYCLAFVGGLVVVGLLWMLYFQHAERQADIQAVTIVGNPDSVILALARSAHAYPLEVATIDSFVSAHGLTPPQYGISDVVRFIKAGADPRAGTHWRLRLFRTHPLPVQRVAALVKSFGSNLG